MIRREMIAYNSSGLRYGKGNRRIIKKFRTSHAIPRISVLTACESKMDASRYFQLAAVAETTLLRLGAFGQVASERSFHETLREIVVPRSEQQLETEALVSANISIDLLRATLVRLLPSSPAYGEALSALAERIDFCIVADAALGDVAAATLRVPLIYDALRIEACVPSVDIPGTSIGILLADLKSAEKRLCKRAAMVIVRGDDDAKALREKLGYPHEPAIINTGVTHDVKRYCTAAQRRAAQTVITLGDRAVAVFESDGSVESICGMLALSEIAEQQTNVLFFVTGTYPLRNYPPNMRFLGRLSETDSVAVRAIADFGVVPYQETSGTAGQAVDFILAGVPLIASPSALKNLPLKGDRDVLVGPPGAFPSLIACTLADPVAAEARAVSALTAVLNAFSPTLSALNFRSLIERLQLAMPVSA